MSTLPWHRLYTLRDDVRAGKLTLAEFAADLNGVRTGAGALSKPSPPRSRSD